MPISMDVGTYNLVCCRRDANNNFVYKREVNAFIEIPTEDRFVFSMMKNAGVPLIEWKDAKVAYALGEAAINIAYSMPSLQLKRPMFAGCLNPKEKHAQQIMAIMMHGLLDEVSQNKELLYYCVPSNAINSDTDADYHNLILKEIFNSFKDDNGKTVVANPINEALALVYSELAKKAYTGLGVSCLCPGTKIYTNNGIVNIEDVKEGDLVLTHKGRWKPITKVITKQFKGINTKLQITGYSNDTNDYSFVDNHEIYVLRNGEWQWIGCESLVEGDVVGEPFENSEKTDKVNTLFIYNKTTSSNEIKKKNIQITSDVYRLIGYFLADGSVNLSEGCIQFDFQTSEIENIKDVQEILLKNFHKNSTITDHGENCKRIKCYGKGLANCFKKNFYEEDKSKKFPWDLKNLSKSSIISLLAGLVRGDGVLGESCISFGNTNTKLIHLARRLFSKLGVPTSINYREPRKGGVGSDGNIIFGKKQEWSVSSGSKTTLNSICDIIKNISCENSKFVEKIFILNNMCCGRIQKIKNEKYSGVVYDLQVEEDHSFSGPFLTIHNCGGGMVNVCYSIFGVPAFQFAITNSGDWIDQQASKVTGESIAYINKEKNKLNLLEDSTDLVQRAIKAQYQIMIQKTAQEIKKGLESLGNKHKSHGAIDIVVSGGTSSPNGFEKLFGDALKAVNVPIEIGEIIKPTDTLYSVARGCLLAAEASVQ